MTATIAFVLGEAWTDPQIGWMPVSSNGYATADSDFLCDVADMLLNWSDNPGGLHAPTIWDASFRMGAQIGATRRPSPACSGGAST